MKFFDFFAGIGGFRLGMEMAGHECVGHCEIDKYAHKSYVAMHRPKETEAYFGDIRTVDPWDLPECDIYCGGFPCQAFSIAGRRRGFEDTRGTLFFEIMRIARERHPKYLFLENVKGLLNHEGGDTFETIITTMAELGYGVEWQVLNSKHFGVPQNRERVFIIGHFGGIGGQQIFPFTEDGRTSIELQRHNNHTIIPEIGTVVATDRQTDRQ
jgi:DNA (cytosine-5)-methyltransferase 1